MKYPLSTVAAALILLSTPAWSQATWYVDAAASGPGSGTQMDPYASLQFAVNAGSTAAGDTILVASGTYIETVNLGGKDLTIDGSGAAMRPILDAAGAGSALVFKSGESASCVVRGLVVRAGTGTDRAGRFYGGGVLVDGASPVLADVRFENNAADTGGGAAVLAGAPSFEQCHFYGNSAGLGGGLYAENATVTVVGGWFESNSASPQLASAYGGGILIGDGGTANIVDARFELNTAASGGGGGLSTTQSSNFTDVLRCEFINNSPGSFAAPGFGGGIYARGPLQATDCDFVKNGTVDPDGVFGGGGARGGEYRDCRFVENSGQLGGGVNGATAKSCTFERNSGCADGSGRGGAAVNSTLENCNLWRNYTCGDGGGAYGSTLTDCDVSFNIASSSNNAPGMGGGLYNCTATGTRIRGNISSGDFGPGFTAQAGGAALSDLTRCLVTSNGSLVAGGLLGGTADRCTIAGNFAQLNFGGVSGGSYDSSIVWHNTPATLGGNPAFTYSNVAAMLPPGVGNLSIDPLFVTASGADVHLRAGSLCIDTGSPMAPLDPDGTPADMGALPYDAGWVTGPASYCPATPTLAGCVADLSTSGPASVSAGVTVVARDVPALAFGLFFLGTQPNAQLVAGTGSFLPNTLCVGGAIRRTSVVMSSNGASPCGGVFHKAVTSADIVGAGGQPGGVLFGQFWFRQPGSTPSFPRSAMSNGLYLPLVP